MQDINKPANKTKKSLRDIFPDSGRSNEPEEIVTNYYSPTSMNPNNNLKLKLTGWPIKVGLILVGLLIIGGLGYAISSQFARVVVKVTPKQGRLLISNVYEATRDGRSGLKFVLASNLQAETTLTVNTTGRETVQEKASGQIIVYNNYSAQSQTLIATTRFQTASGLIYRTPTAVVVPGTTKDNQGQIIPGQIEITVIADQAGVDYNISPTDFSIPGFKGTPKATKIYARSKIAMTGGFVGERGKISATDKAKAETELKKTLAGEIVRKLKPQVPDDYLLFDDAVVMNFTSSILPVKDSANPDKATFKMTVNATGVLLNEEELSKYLAAQQVPDYQAEPVKIINWPQLKFTLQNKDSLNINNLEKISFKLEGNGHLVWSFDEKNLKTKLRSATSNNYKEIFDKDFPTIQTANVIFSPPWIRTIPADETKIKIETVNVTQP